MLSLYKLLISLRRIKMAEQVVKEGYIGEVLSYFMEKELPNLGPNQQVVIEEEGKPRKRITVMKIKVSGNHARLIRLTNI